MARRVVKRKMPSTPSELDLVSEYMNPEKVLAAKHIRLPNPKAKIFNNLAEYYSYTFLKMDDRKKTVKDVVLHQKRNYAWYYSTMGYDPSYGNEYYTDMNKRFNRRKRRKHKKPHEVSVIPSEPMRSKKVVNIKSDYANYCRRKFPKWFKEYSSSYESSLVQDTTPRMSLDKFVVQILESSHVETTPTSLLQNDVRNQKTTNFSRNVLLTFEKHTDPLSFLKCIIFGKVDIDRPLTINVYVNGKRTLDLPLPLFAQSAGVVPETSVFLCLDIPAASKDDNAAYETESSGYMSDGSEVDLNARHNSMLSIIKSKNASRLSKQTEISMHKNVLKAKENGALTEEDLPSSDLEIEHSKPIIVSIDRKLVKLDSVKNPLKKENKLPVGCNSKITKELSCQCTCGFYNNAVDEIRKFKIPRKCRISS